MCLWQVKLSQAKTIITEKKRLRRKKPKPKRTQSVFLRKRNASRSNEKNAAKK